MADIGATYDGEMAEIIKLRAENEQLKLSIEKTNDIIDGMDERIESGGCLYAGPGRGDCEHFIGLPGQSIPNQHDGPDDTVDAYGKPNGWCWSCWRSKRIAELEETERLLQSALDNHTGAMVKVGKRLSEAEQRIADAPHTEYCAFNLVGVEKCCCWKSK